MYINIALVGEEFRGEMAEAGVLKVDAGSD